ncbi:hypothetical protein BOTBODRAFT_26805 [Botryobasidium botryosum FD-172 SS1]|uniref:Uncharacterized protein n=1 Tax=Botryobasidium botryosum (strain FD-172 SS1) TaxID=930990 RepID=A0A067N1H0_BOTB1|nr:hypothetical protein BOTBODRAFT_26805 [Botryobasidium botryosum FD-172 SS1]
MTAWLFSKVYASCPLHSRAVGQRRRHVPPSTPCVTDWALDRPRRLSSIRPAHRRNHSAFPFCFGTSGPASACTHPEGKVLKICTATAFGLFPMSSSPAFLMNVHDNENELGSPTESFNPHHQVAGNAGPIRSTSHANFRSSVSPYQFTQRNMSYPRNTQMSPGYPPDVPRHSQLTPPSVTLSIHPNEAPSPEAHSSSPLAYFDFGGLGQYQRNELQQFGQMSTSNQLLSIFAYQLKNAALVSALDQSVRDARERIERLESLIAVNWAPSGDQEECLVSLLKHFVIQPLDTYESYWEEVEKHLQTMPARYGFPNYDASLTVQNGCRRFLIKHAPQVKQTFRKVIWASVENHQSIYRTSQAIAKEFHLRIAPNPLPEVLQARYCFLRDLAVPFAGKVKAKEANYWEIVETQLKALSKANGKDRSSAQWRTWEARIIEDDLRQFEPEMS